jgi:hypothetical protein
LSERVTKPLECNLNGATSGKTRAVRFVIAVCYWLTWVASDQQQQLPAIHLAL